MARAGSRARTKWRGLASLPTAPSVLSVGRTPPPRARPPRARQGAERGPDHALARGRRLYRPCTKRARRTTSAGPANPPRGPSRRDEGDQLPFTGAPLSWTSTQGDVWFGPQTGHPGLFLRPPTLEDHRHEIQGYGSTQVRASPAPHRSPPGGPQPAIGVGQSPHHARTRPSEEGSGPRTLDRTTGPTGALAWMDRDREESRLDRRSWGLARTLPGLWPGGRWEGKGLCDGAGEHQKALQAFMTFM